MNFTEYRLNNYDWLPAECQKEVSRHNKTVDKFEASYARHHADREAKAVETVSQKSADGFMKTVDETIERELGLAGQERDILKAQATLADELADVGKAVSDVRHTEYLKTLEGITKARAKTEGYDLSNLPAQVEASCRHSPVVRKAQGKCNEVSNQRSSLVRIPARCFERMQALQERVADFKRSLLSADYV